jgi:Carboxypeptidase regulatory-like domain
MKSRNCSLVEKLGAPGRYATLALMFLLASPVFAQVQFGQITGLVTDPTGRVVPGVAVTVINEQTGVKRETVTNTDGYYLFTPLNPGLYNVSVLKTGFKTETRSGITLEVAQTGQVNFTLSLGRVAQTVQVKAAPAMLQTEQGSLGEVTPQSGVVNLPLNGRNYMELATLVPGVVSEGLSTFFFTMPTSNLSINGSRESAADYVIDGQDVMEQFTSGSSFTPPPDAIQEFKVETSNMDTMYGNGSGVVNVALKSGTNQIHGDAYDFMRNTSLDARNFFAPATPPLIQNQYGATLGGPIKKNKAFLFGSWQGTRILNGETFDSIIPSVAERNGDFSALLPATQLTNPYTGAPLPNNQLPSISPSANYLQNLFIPLPNSPQGTYVVSPKETANDDEYDIRFDDQIRPSDSIAATYELSNWDLYNPGPFPDNGATYGPSRDQFTNLSWTHSFGAAAVNLAHVGYSREASNETGQGIGTNYTEQAGIGGFAVTSAEFPGPPGINPSGYTGINEYPFVPLPQTYNQFMFGDVLTLVKGKHTLEMGGDARWWSGFNLNGAFSRGDFFFNGTYTGNSYADYLSGLPYLGYRTFPRNWFGAYEQDQDFYFQDTWKATPKLTLIGGLRYDLIHPNTSMGDWYASMELRGLSPTGNVIVTSNSKGQINTNTQQVEEFLLPLVQSEIIPSAQVGLPQSLIHTELDGFAPRVGLAYSVGHGFVVRSAYGIFHPLEQANQMFSSGGVNIPFIADEEDNFNTTPVPDVTLASMFPTLTPGSLTLSELGQLDNATIDPWQRDPYIQEWNFSVQKLVKSVLSLQASYVGNKGTKLTFSTPTNVPSPGPGSIESRRPDPEFAQGILISTGGLSNYQALQMTAETRTWHGLYFLGAYTWGKAMDDQTEDDQSSPVQNPNDLAAEYGISDFNVASNFEFSSTYNLPFLKNRHGLLGLAGGWSVNNIISLQSGLPFTPVPATDPANTGTNMRADRIGRGTLPNPTIQEWFNVADFPTPALYTYGSAARNILTGPSYGDWDFSLFKNFNLSAMREGMALQFRGEFFNFTNAVNFGLPNATVGTTTAGEITSAGAPREVQLVLKLLW